MSAFDAYADLRRLVAETVELSRVLCEDSRLLAEEVAVRRSVRVRGKRREVTAKPERP